MNIEIKSLRTHTSLSSESLCFSASLYINGKRRGSVSDEGVGGPLIYSDSTVRAEIENALSHADRTVMIHVQEAILENELRKKIHSAVVYIDAGELKSISVKNAGTLERMMRWPERIASNLRVQVADILNCMPIERAVQVLQEHAH